MGVPHCKILADRDGSTYNRLLVDDRLIIIIDIAIIGSRIQNIACSGCLIGYWFLRKAKTTHHSPVIGLIGENIG